MKRRSFIKRTAAASSLPFFLGGFSVNALGRTAQMNELMRTADESDRVLVLVQLNGGNDGLATLLPLDQYANLSNARSNILIPETSALNLTTETGFHPAMTGMHQMYQDGKLGIVQDVGYPEPNFSHFRSTDIWNTGSPSDEVWETGWLGRYLELDHPDFPEGYPNNDFPDPLAITIGSIVSNTCQGTSTSLGMAISDPEAFTQLLEGGNTDPPPETPYGHELAFLRLSMQQTNLYLETIGNAYDLGTNMSTMYSTTSRLAAQLKIVARLISGGLQTKIYIVSLGGFDTHANQTEIGDPLTGMHTNLLQDLSDSIQAFQDDLQLQSLEERVLGMTFSEFGRRIADNDSWGTDHGAAAPLFVFGTQVNPTILGTNPQIPVEVEPKDSVPMQYDFRSVYGSVLMDWFCIEQTTIEELLFADFQYIPMLLSTCTATAVEDELLDGLHLSQNYPNPFSGTTRIKFKSDGGRVQICLFDRTGRRIDTLTDQHFPPGEYEMAFDGHDLSEGIYYYRMQHQNRHISKMMAIERK